VGGLTLGMTVALVINFVVLIWLLRRKIGVIGLARTAGSLLRVLGVSAVMGAVIWLVDWRLAEAVGATSGGYGLRLAVGVVVGVAVFLLAARLVKMPELAEAVDMLRAVLKRSKQEDKSA
jgi:putative peptidoglycan lipid II flippase